MRRRGSLRNATLLSYGGNRLEERGWVPEGPGGSGAAGAPPGPRVFGVTDLTRYISSVLEGDPLLRDVWVRGEVSNFHHHQSGHMYFDLKDAAAVLRCVMFREVNRALRFTITNGMKLLVRGGVIVYAAKGEYELRVAEARPEGVGELFLAFEQLKRKLEEEGLFDPKIKRTLPFLPRIVGVVTSPTGAVLQDIKRILFGRFPNAHLLLAPARVQGEGAADELVAAIRLLNSLEEEGPDVIILARGGGSLEDLWPFNEEKVARAIRASRVPVVSAVGHETDFTIADFAADARAPTPSKAAEMVVPDKAELEGRIADLRRALDRELISRFDQARLRTDELTRALGRAVGNLLARKRERLLRLSSMLNAMSPGQVLARGYSITLRRSTGRAVRDPASLRRGEELLTVLSGGEVVSAVKGTSTRREGWIFTEMKGKRAGRRG
ncbi:MAG: exodeoxyribonuclease VII large subunit [Thermoplasmata archaeon]